MLPGDSTWVVTEERNIPSCRESQALTLPILPARTLVKDFLLQLHLQARRSQALSHHKVGTDNLQDDAQ
jgi:hypothetical protein